MSLRGKFLLYLLGVHLLMAGIGVWVLLERRGWLVAVELAIALSLFVGWRSTRAFFVPLELLRTGAELIEERDFTTRFRRVGQPEMDHLIGVYNRMIDDLRAERLRLVEQVEFFDRVVEASPGGVLICDHDGRLERLNPSAEALLGAPSDKLVGCRPDELGGELGHVLGETLEGLGVGESAVVALADGRRVRCQRSEFRDRGFARTFYLLEELSEELRRSEKEAYEKLIRMMSHEVGNTVAAVRSLLMAIAAHGEELGEARRAEFHRALDVAAGRMDRLSAFMNRFAEVVRLPAPERRAVDPRELLEDLVTLLGPELEERRIRVQWRISEPAKRIEADKNQLEQVFLNVLRNAIEAIGEDGEIRIELEGSRVAIEDDGGGIPRELRDRLFTPFLTTKAEGCGLGLTVIKEILLRHGFAFSLGNGRRGARFEVVLR